MTFACPKWKSAENQIDCDINPFLLNFTEDGARFELAEGVIGTLNGFQDHRFKPDSPNHPSKYKYTTHYYECQELFPVKLLPTKIIPVSGEYVDRKSTRLNSSHLGISYAV